LCWTRRWITAENSDPEEELLRADEVRKLRQLIEGLSQNERSIISLKFGGGLTNRDIARTLGLSESNVGVIVYRTVRRLRDGFGEAEDG
jgi:RNA polymerase sigma-70 factor (ECF subfamily)